MHARPMHRVTAAARACCSAADSGRVRAARHRVRASIPQRRQARGRFKRPRGDADAPGAARAKSGRARPRVHGEPLSAVHGERAFRRRAPGAARALFAARRGHSQRGGHARHDARYRGCGQALAGPQCTAQPRRRPGSLRAWVQRSATRDRGRSDVRCASAEQAP